MNTIDRYEIGRRLKKCREDLGLSQEEVAERCGISKSYYGNIERGKRAMSLDTLLSISSAYSVSADFLLREGMERPEEAFTAIFEEAKRSGELQYKKFLNAITALSKIVEQL